MAFDEVQYKDYADSIKTFGLYAHSFRLYGYPVFIFIIENIFGKLKILGLAPWQFVQFILDIVNTVLIFSTARVLFKNLTAAFITFVVYLFNPFTTAYTGVMLPEILAISIFSLIYFTGTHVNFIGQKATKVLLGFLTQVRPAYFYYSLAMLTILGFYVFNKFPKKRIVYLALMVFAFFVPFLYTIFGNYRWFNEFALTDVDRLNIQNFYISMFIRDSPKIRMSFDEYPKEARWAYAEYSYNKKSYKDRKETRDLFFKLAIDEAVRDPIKFFVWRIEKIWFVMQKHSIFPYQIPDSRTEAAIYWGNLTLLASSLVGFIAFLKVKLSDKTKNGRWLVLFTGLPVAYTMAANMFTTTEERYSLPIYPLIMLFSGFGIYTIWKYAATLKYRGQDNSSRLYKIKSQDQ